MRTNKKIRGENVEIQLLAHRSFTQLKKLSNFIYFRLVSLSLSLFFFSQGASGQYFYRHHLIFLLLRLPLACLWLALWAREREGRRERGDLLRVTGSSNSSGNSHRDWQLSSVLSQCFLVVVVVILFLLNWRFSSTSLGELAVVPFLLVNYSK